MTEQTMLADLMPLAGAQADLSAVVGTWVNSNPDSKYIARIVASEQDGALLIRPYGTSTAEPVDWGQVEATPYMVVGSKEPTGFHARYDFGAVRTEIAATQKLGILVIQSYTSFHDGSGRLSHIGREFFHQGRPDDGPAGSLVGNWVNSNPHSDWITGFTLTERTGGPTLQVRVAGEPAGWGETEPTVYEDHLGEPAFSASYDRGDVEAVLAANSNKGLVIIAAFLRFTDGRTNYLSREFYYRQP